MYGYIYKITCTEGTFTDRFYIGQRKWSGDIAEDKYKGSGKIIKDYYKKYPKGYRKEILAIAESLDELNCLEKDFIRPHLHKDYCLNVIDGGHHGTDYVPTKEVLDKISKALKGKPAWNKGIKIGYSARKGVHLSEETKKKISEAKKGYPSPRKGIRLSEETKAKLSAAHTGKVYCTRGKKVSAEEKARLASIRRQYPVVQIDKDTNQIIAVYESSHSASRAVGVCSCSILRCCHKKKSFLTAGGYIWEFEKNITQEL